MLSEKEKRRMGFLEEDEAMFGLTSGEVLELINLREKAVKL